MAIHLINLLPLPMRMVAPDNYEANLPRKLPQMALINIASWSRPS